MKHGDAQVGCTDRGARCLAAVVGEGVGVTGEGVDDPFVEGRCSGGGLRPAKGGEAVRHEARVENEDAFFAQWPQARPELEQSAVVEAAVGELVHACGRTRARRSSYAAAGVRDGEREVGPFGEARLLVMVIELSSFTCPSKCLHLPRQVKT